MSKIENRNLIVVDTFDEFARATKDMDFSVEDLVAYITNISQVFYWLNVESVWGRMGFVWDSLDHSTNQGYGHFVTTQIPFTVIPSLPDGERITAMIGDTFNSISTNELTVLRSNWENLDVVSSLTPSSGGRNVRIDLTGAPLENKMGKPVVLMLGPNGGNTLYIKGDFSNILEENSAAFHVSGYLKSGRPSNILKIDDDNLYLNFPSVTNNVYRYNIYYEGSEPFREEFVWKDITSDSNFTGNSQRNVGVKSSNLKYILKDHSYKIGILKSDYDASDYKNVLTDFTIDCSEFKQSTTNIIDFFGTSFADALLPIKFIGEALRIDSYNPYVYIEDEWPELDTNIFNKLDSDGYIIYKPKFNRFMIACPYVIDTSNFTSLKVEMTSVGHTSDTTEEERLERINYDGSKIDVLPTFINIHKFNNVTFGLPNSIYINNRNESVFNIIKYNFESDSYILPNIYLPQNIKLTGRNFSIDRLTIFDTSVPSIHFKTDDATIGYKFTCNQFVLGNSSNGKANYFSFESLDDSILALSTLNTFNNFGGGNSYTEYVLPFIFAGSGSFELIDTTLGEYTRVKDIIFNPVKIYISNNYSLFFTLPQSTQSDTHNTFWTYTNIKRIIDSIRNDSAGGRTLTLKQWIFEQLTQAEKDHIIQDLNYTLIEQI